MWALEALLFIAGACIIKLYCYTFLVAVLPGSEEKNPKFKDFKFCGVFIDLFLSVFNVLHLCVSMCMRRGQVPVESRRGPWILGLWAAWHGCWELNLSPPQEQ